MSVSDAFTGSALGHGIIVPPKQSVTYEVTGTFTGTVHLERVTGGVSVVQLAVTVADTALAEATYQNVTDKSEFLQWRGVVATGTATAVIDEVAGQVFHRPTQGPQDIGDVRNKIDGTLLMRFRDDGVEIPVLVGALDDSGTTTVDGVGAKAGATVTVLERGNDVVHRTVLTLTATPITLTDDSGVGQFGGFKLYDFPAGNIKVLGAVIDAILTLTDPLWTDAAEGDVALGAGIVDDADALDGLFVDILASTAIAAMTAQVGPIDAQSLANEIPLGGAGGFDSDLNLNVRIDDAAAHITDGGFITGTVTITWVNLGDF